MKTIKNDIKSTKNRYFGTHGTHGDPWRPMGTHGAPWEPSGTHGDPLGPIGTFGFFLIWIFYFGEIFGIPWDPMGPHGILCDHS